MLRSPALHSRKVAYTRNIRDSRYLDLVLSGVIRIVGKWVCCALKSGPQKDAPRSKPSDEHALILVLILLCKLISK